MKTNISKKIIKNIASLIKKRINKTCVGDIYPLIEYDDNQSELVMNWYLETLISACAQTIEKYPVKHLFMGIFYYYLLDFPIPLDISSVIYLPYSPFDNVILENELEDTKPILIKIVDNDDNIYFYNASSKLYTYSNIDIKSNINDIFNNLISMSFIDGKNDTIIQNVIAFADNLSQELKYKFNMPWVYDIIRQSNRVIKIVLDNTQIDNTCIIDIIIKPEFKLYDVEQILKAYNISNKSAEDVMKEYMYIYMSNSNQLIKFNEISTYLNRFNIFYNILNYIYSATHLLNPLCEHLLSVLSNKYENLKWFRDAIEMLEKDPNYSFEDLFTVIKYNVNEEALKVKYLNIYNT